jgi:hypothetical protein
MIPGLSKNTHNTSPHFWEVEIDRIRQKTIDLRLYDIVIRDLIRNSAFSIWIPAFVGMTALLTPEVKYLG